MTCVNRDNRHTFFFVQGSAVQIQYKSLGFYVSGWKRRAKNGSSGRTVLSGYPNFLGDEGKTVSSTEARTKAVFAQLLSFLSPRFLLESRENIRKY